MDGRRPSQSAPGLPSIPVGCSGRPREASLSSCVASASLRQAPKQVVALMTITDDVTP